MRQPRRVRATAAIAALTLTLTACGDDTADESPTAADTDGSAEADTDTDGSAEDGTGAAGDDGDVEAAACEPGSLPTLADGVLTIGTDSPAFPPWFEDDDPSNGEGFESAVAYAVAEELGFSADQVEWTVVPFNSSYAPGPKDFDFDINQISITEEREQAVDFSDGYYDVNQAIVGYDDSEAVGATTVAELADLRLGAQIGTTSLDFITDVIQPSAEPFVYDTNNDAKSALDAGQIDAVVLDLPTAFYVSAVEIEGSSVIGQFPSVGDDPEQFGLLFEEGNPLRDCVNEALAALESSGRLDEIEQEWLSDATGAPVIEVE